MSYIEVRSNRRPRMRARAALLLALSVVVSACGPSQEAGYPAPAPACRQARSVEGGPTPGEIRWVVPADERVVLDRWCAGVGPAVFRPAPPRWERSQVDSIAVISWNAHVGGGDLVQLVADLRAGRLTGEAPVRHFVLLLQEVHRAGPTVPSRTPDRGVPGRVVGHPADGERIDIVEAARALGLSLLYVPSMRNGSAPPGRAQEDRGNAILSTLPLEDPAAVELPFEAQRRVAVTAMVSATTHTGSPWELLVSSTHLDTRSTGTRFWATFGAGRQRQAEALVDALPTDFPAVVAGDLNTWSLSSLEGTLPFLRSLFPQTPCPIDEPTFVTEWGFRRRLDHVFFRLPEDWAARSRRLDDRYGSDHFPLLAWATIATAPGSQVESMTGRCA